MSENININAVKIALEALKENHQFHIDYDDYDGYPESHLWGMNTSAIRLLELILEKENG